MQLHKTQHEQDPWIITPHQFLDINMSTKKRSVIGLAATLQMYKKTIFTGMRKRRPGCAK
ncbi:hypothetical protein BC939DRAFT_463613 [Gamsiella multidivaricata]|uniref:uncharacterized protein n=1 Tax=Gamsiella multidivaricata TaxID=101098 RepID=UPI00221E92A6|nr:uncharacterized protein BC939DRAFT_463613 [Gamsiella multidivaricata]KAI7818201.1 hypothetical protein BC939DRAFT_463613 [Gamsiella multidivaricata]